jgi:hypothetical protein
MSQQQYPLDWLIDKDEQIWQWHVNIFSMHIDDQADATSPALIKILEKYEMMERLSLLEVVVWKASCISYHARHTNSSTSFVTMQDIEDYWALDENFNPLEYRRQRRIESASGITVIIQNVMPFL